MDLLDHGTQHLHVIEEEMDGVEGGDVSKVMLLVNDRFEIGVRFPNFQPATL